MANVRMQLPDGREIDIDEGLLKDPKVNQQFQDMFDTAKGDQGVVENVFEKGKDFTRGVLQNVSGGLKFVSTTEKQLSQLLPDVMQGEFKRRSASELPLYKAGEWLDKVIPSDARSRGTFASQVATGLGQVAGSVGLGVATGGASIEGQVIAGTGAAMGLQSSEDYQRAKDKGASEQQALTAGNWGGVWGATDVLPLAGMFKILQKANPGWKGLVKDAAGQFILEGGQEGFQQLMSNVTAKLTYDEQQKLMEEVLPSASVGGVVGAIAGTVLNMLGAKGKVKVAPVNVGGPSEQSAISELEKLRARGVGATAEETTIATPAEVVEGEPTTVDTIQANEEGILTPSQRFVKQMLEAGKSDSEIHTNLTLLNVIAQTRGMDLNTFVEKSIAEVRGGDTNG